MKYYCAVDIETGGIGDDKSILQVYAGFFRLTNKKFHMVDDINLLIKPNSKVYCITAESLSITGINLIDHDKNAIYEKQAGTLLYDKLRSWYNVASDKLIPIGHNVAFDIRKITNTLIHADSWSQYVSYRVLDTCTISQFMRITGKLPEDISCSLPALVKHFNINTDGKSHEAKYDTLVTVQVLENLLNL